MKSRNTSSLAPDKKSEYFIPRPRLKCLYFKDFCSLVLRLAADAIQLRQSQAQWPAAKYANLRRYAATQVCYKNMRLSKLRGCNWKLSHQASGPTNLPETLPDCAASAQSKKGMAGAEPWAWGLGSRQLAPGRSQEGVFFVFFWFFFRGLGNLSPEVDFL